MSPTLIDQIYEAVFVPERWDEVLAAVGKMMNAPAASIITFDQSKPVAHKGTRPFEAANEIFCATDIKSDNSFHLRKSRGFESQAVAVTYIPNGEVLVFALEKLGGDAPFNADNIAILNGLFPHFARAGLMAMQLRSQRTTAATDALQAVGLAAAVVNPAGRVLASNCLFNQPNALGYSISGRLILADKVADGLFQEVIEATRVGMDPLVRSIPIAAHDNQPPMVVHAIPLLRSAGHLLGAEILVVITEVSAAGLVPSPSLLIGLFDLEPAEARLAAALAEGKSLKDAAVERGIRYNSARTYLTRILRKTGTRQQSELVALLKSVQAAQVKQGN